MGLSTYVKEPPWIDTHIDKDSGWKHPPTILTAHGLVPPQNTESEGKKAVEEAILAVDVEM